MFTSFRVVTQNGHLGSENRIKEHIRVSGWNDTSHCTLMPTGSLESSLCVDAVASPGSSWIRALWLQGWSLGALLACLSEKEGVMLASPVCVGALVGTRHHGQSQVPMGGVRCRTQNRYEELPSQGWGSQGPPVPPCPTASTVPHCVEAVIACF